VAWALESTTNGSRLVVPASAELDVVDLGVTAAQDYEHGHHPPLTVIGAFASLSAPEDLSRFLVGGTVLDTVEFLGRRCPSEQTALSIYRVARLRGGAFWDGVATHVAEVVAQRVERAAGAAPVHDLMGHRETHVRFLVDAALLLLAEAEHKGDSRFGALSRRVLDALDGFSVPWAGGTWYLHDSLERDTEINHLVLNTHVHALVVRLAAGRRIDDGLLALDRSLSLTGEGTRSAVLAATLAVSDRMRASSRGALADAGQRLNWMAQASAGRSRARAPRLRLPGGWMARDIGPSPNPAYLMVNLHDLAVLQRNRSTIVAGRALRAGIRYGRFSGFFDAERTLGNVAAVLLPIALANAGYLSAARQEATRLRRHGVDPAVGWPGFTDQLWSQLASGTP
jgi:hypothetical protein